MRLIKLLVCACVVASSGVVHAQYVNPYTGGQWNNPISSSIDTMIYQRIQTQILQRAIAAQHGKAAEPAKVAHKAVSASDFTPADKGRPTVERYMASAGLEGEQKATLKKIIDLTFTEVEKQLRKNSVASALGFVIGTSLEITTGKELADSDAKELIAGINDLLAASPEFAKLKAGDKQEMYESLILTGALLLTTYEAGKGDEAMKKSSVAMAQAVLTQLTGSKTAN